MTFPYGAAVSIRGAAASATNGRDCQPPAEPPISLLGNAVDLLELLESVPERSRSGSSSASAMVHGVGLQHGGAVIMLFCFWE